MTPNDRALLEWKRAASQEVRAIDLYLRGQLAAADLRRELRRAEQTRLKCTAYLPADEHRNALVEHPH